MEPLIGWAIIGAAIGFTLGVAIGAMIALMWRRLREAELRAELQALRGQAAPEAMRESLRALTGEALKELLHTADQQLGRLLEPLKGTLNRLEQQLHELERNEARERGSLKTELEQLSRAVSELQKSTTKLSHALKAPSPRGRWAEIQLQRLVEMAGMQRHVDFSVQVSVGEKERPDMIIYLPNNRCIIVDAKAPMDAYLQALESDDEQKRRDHLKAHARNLKNRIRELGNREYWRANEKLSLEFVVMYIPGEGILSAAFEEDGELLEYAFQHRVVLATPLILLALLKTIAYGWQQQQTLQNAQEIIRQSQELSQLMYEFIKCIYDLGKELKKAVDKYNDVVELFDTKLSSSLIRMYELQGRREEPSPLKRIRETPRIDE